MTRLPLVCTHRPPCPGCPRFGSPGVDRAAFLALGALAANAGLEPPAVHEGPRVGFRHRARLSVRGRAANPKIGIFEEGTHRLVHIPNCAVHHPLVNYVAATTRKCLVDFKLSPYSDSAHLGQIRALQVVVERATERAQVVVVTCSDDPAGLEEFFVALGERLGPRLHSLWWNGQPERSNTILGPHFLKISGPHTVVETIGGARVHYPPGAFGQSNLPLFEALARRVGTFVPDGVQVLELYAGTGALGLPLAHRVARLTVNELGEASLAGLGRGIAELEPEVVARIDVVPGAAATSAPRVAGADVLIVDPPRKGLDPEILEAIVQNPPERLVYVSCGLRSFLAETEQLLGSGRVRLAALEIYALFPFTEHVETLAVFERAPSA
jgi:tRNA/tmRNA/rRNA uracil-C5-methylase (TrmA/RlmC/RlmD family)